MTRLRRIAHWIDLLASVFSAAFICALVLGLHAGAGEGSIGGILGRARGVMYAGIALSALLLAGAILRAVQHGRQGGGRRCLTLESEQGATSISAAGVEASIVRSLGNIEELADASVRLVIPRDGGLPSGIRVRCRLFDRPNVPAIEARIRANVVECYQSMFPSDGPAPQVRVSIEGIVFETPGPKVPPEASAPRADGEASASCSPATT